MRRLLSSESGNVVVTAMWAIALMSMLGLATMAQVDTQSGESRKERVRESSFNLTEAALSAQTFILGRKGAGTAMPAECPNASSQFCPDPARIARSYDQATQNDFDPAKTSWKTWVRDNRKDASEQPEYYWDDSLLTTQPTYDANGDKHLWVRSEGVVRGRKRAIVALIRMEDRAVNFPRYSILAGRFATSNNGRHSAGIVDTTGSLGVTVRCNGGADCLDYEEDKGQISPNVTNTGYSGPPAVSADDLDSLIDVARANKTYYTSCPADPSGAVVVVDTTATCSYTGNSTFNSPTSPGLLVITRGGLYLGGSTVFHGLLYMANTGDPPRTDANLVELQGNSQVQGGVIVDGPAGIEAGSSGRPNVAFKAAAFDNVRSFGTAGVVQNTWREIRPRN